MVNSSVPKAVPSAVAPSAANSVPVNDKPGRGPHIPMKGSAVIPVVPRTETPGSKDMLPNPAFGGRHTGGGPRVAGSEGAPSVPLDGHLFKKLPVDSHYTSEDQGGRDPNRKINRLDTLGWWTRIQVFSNNAAHTGQDVDNAGWRVRPGQQRTSVMRNALPPHGEYGTQTYVPRQLPQRGESYKYLPSTGTDRYGTGVLNSDTFGAGQTAGGVGGNNFTPQPGPPDTNSTAGIPDSGSGMPSWG